MKNFVRLCTLLAVLWLGLWSTGNYMLSRTQNSSAKQYLVDAERIVIAMENGSEIDPDDYPEVTAVTAYDGDSELFSRKGEYIVREINGRLYRIDYTDNSGHSLAYAKKLLNIIMGVGTLMLAGTMIYLRRTIIKPFTRISDLPEELAKGGLHDPLKENKSRYFGKFIWGLNMLREELEQAQVERLEQTRNEKTMLLSLSHDIKTPLSAIKLYSSALAKGLYPDKDKQKEAALNINAKADEIEGYVSQIIRSSTDDLMHFEVNDTEFYLSRTMNRINAYYKEKLSSLSIGFTSEKFSDCMLRGDPDRLAEVLQNIIENAIKYGDGHQISISFSEEEDCRLIAVENTGVPPTDSEMDHIFDSFKRGANADGKPGSGLGLYICRRLMHSMNGDIFADALDGGMRVTVVCKKA